MSGQRAHFRKSWWTQEWWEVRADLSWFHRIFVPSRCRGYCKSRWIIHDSNRPSEVWHTGSLSESKHVVSKVFLMLYCFNRVNLIHTQKDIIRLSMNPGEFTNNPICDVHCALGFWVPWNPGRWVLGLHTKGYSSGQRWNSLCLTVTGCAFVRPWLRGCQ